MGITTWQPLADQVAIVAGYAKSAQQSDSDAQVQAKLAKQAAVTAVSAAEAIGRLIPLPPWIVTGNWAPNTNYATTPTPDYVVYAGKGYVCNTPHQSGVSFTPGYWTVAVDPTPLIAAFFTTLPTSLPGTAGVVWNNGGAVCIS